MGNIAAILVYSFFTFTMLLSVASTARAQEGTTPPQQTLPKGKTFTLSGTYSIEEIFDLMDKATGIYVNRSSKVIDFSQQVTVHFRSTPVAEVMDKVLGDQLVDWTYRGSNIILFRSRHPVRLKSEEQLITVSGMVMDNDGVALPGVTIMVKGEQKGGVTNGSGFYKIERVHPQSVLIVNSIGFLSRQYRLDGERTKNFILEPAVAQIEAVEVTANTGYQVLKKRETPGAITVIDSSLINRATSVSIFDRLDNISSGLLVFRTPGIVRSISRLPDFADMGLYMRGFSTVSPNKVNPNPLVVLDNFPFEGDLRSINPNDVSSMTILKDASAAGVWGARSGNGVIVITTNKGRYQEKMHIDFNSNFILRVRPRLSYDLNYLNAPDYIAMERYLFNQGFFSSDLNNVSLQPALSPVVELLSEHKSGRITDAELSDQLSLLGKHDVRNDFRKYSYRNAFTQQYHIGIRGGNKDYAYYLSVGHDKDNSNVTRNSLNRTSIISSNIFKPAKGLEVSAFLNYSQQDIREGNMVLFRGVQGGNSKFSELFPYAIFRNDKGAPKEYAKDFNGNYLDSLSHLGFQNWKYSPLDEIENTIRKTTIQNLILRASIKYTFLKKFEAELQYQNQSQLVYSKYFYDKDSYFARDLVNVFTIYNSSTRTFTHNLPQGGILMTGDYDWRVHNLRGNLSYRNRFKDHHLKFLIGGEVRELSAEGGERISVGYEDINGIPVTNVNGSAVYPILPSGTSTINDKLDLVSVPGGILNRYISYFSVLDYSYLGKYDLTVTGRKDGANFFGANVNRKFSPFWSIAGGWSIYKEDFFKSKLINLLRLRASLGVNGNIYNGNSYLTLNKLSDPDPLTGLPRNSINNPPNNDLSWEKIRMTNIGYDISLLNSRISFSGDYFEKRNHELVQPVTMAPQTGYLSAEINSATTKVRGFEFIITGNVKIEKIQWYSRLSFARLTEKVRQIEMESAQQSLILLSPFNSILSLKGKPLKGMFSYKWAGLDPKTGDPQGFLNGNVSKDYNGIKNSAKEENLVYHGSGVPTIFGSMINGISYRNFNMSFNIVYRLGYFFRRPGVPLNYSDLLKTPHRDFVNAWSQPGDERVTSIPSISFNWNDARNQFYQRSEVLVERADNIRLQDVRISYIFRKKEETKSKFRSAELFCYMNNLGIIWRANKVGLDPDVNHRSVLEAFPVPFSISWGLSVKM